MTLEPILPVASFYSALLYVLDICNISVKPDYFVIEASVLNSSSMFTSFGMSPVFPKAKVLKKAVALHNFTI